MSWHDPTRGVDDRPRRYVLHLSCARRRETGEWRYVGHIRPWVPRTRVAAKAKEHEFDNESKLIETLNPLLPHGSDVRDVLSHIESPDGFFYLLHLTAEQAAKLGWRH